MGMFTVYDILTGNPGTVRHVEKGIDDNGKKFSWNEDVRAILKDGTVTNVGKYDMEGYITIKNSKKSFLSFFKKKDKYAVTDDATEGYYEFDGYLLNNTVHKMLTKHKDFKKCFKNKNIFEFIQGFYKKNFKLTTKYQGVQEISIVSGPSVDDVAKKDIWMFEDPKTNKRNKKRIEKIINNFIKFACKGNSKTTTQINLIFKNDKHNKFWTIEYKESGEYRIRYGKIGTDGRTISKNEGIMHIAKLIQNKLKKGYKQKTKRILSKFTIPA